MRKNKRTLKVYKQSGYNDKSTPMLMLKGAWLEEEQVFIEQETKKFQARLVAERRMRYGK